MQKSVCFAKHSLRSFGKTDNANELSTIHWRFSESSITIYLDKMYVENGSVFKCFTIRVFFCCCLSSFFSFCVFVVIRFHWHSMNSESNFLNEFRPVAWMCLCVFFSSRSLSLSCLSLHLPSKWETANRIHFGEWHAVVRCVFVNCVWISVMPLYSDVTINIKCATIQNYDKDEMNLNIEATTFSVDLSFDEREKKPMKKNRNANNLCVLRCCRNNNKNVI